MSNGWWTHKTFWASAVGMVAAVAGLWAALDPAHAIKIGTVATAIAAFLGNLGSIFARSGGVDAAKQVASGASPEDVG